MASLQKQRSTLDDFQIVKTLGKGAFGSVSLVQRKKDGRTYALKRVICNGMSKREISDILGEIRFLASIDHPNIVGFFDSFLHGSSEVCIVMEFASGGDLTGKISDAAKEPRGMPEENIWRFWIQIVAALAHLHHLRILHRDLKPANVFLMSDGTVKLGDLNVSRLVKAGLVRTQIGTPLYMAPELWASKPYDGAADIWSAGCILYELAMGKPPFTGRDMGDLSRRVQGGAYPPIPPERGYSKELVGMVAACMSVVPVKRPSANAILSSPAVLKWKERIGHLIGPTLEAEARDKAGAKESIRDTIELPANMRGLGGLRALAEVLPSPQFDQDHFKVNPGAGRPATAAAAVAAGVIPVRPLPGVAAAGGSGSGEPAAPLIPAAAPRPGPVVVMGGGGALPHPLVRVGSAAPRLSAALPAAGSQGDANKGSPYRGLPGVGAAAVLGAGRGVGIGMGQGASPLAQQAAAGRAPGTPPLAVRIGQVVVHGSGGAGPGVSPLAARAAGSPGLGMIAGPLAAPAAAALPGHRPSPLAVRPGSGLASGASGMSSESNVTPQAAHGRGPAMMRGPMGGRADQLPAAGLPSGVVGPGGAGAAGAARGLPLGGPQVLLARGAIAAAQGAKLPQRR